VVISPAQPNPQLQNLVDLAVKETLAKFAGIKLKTDELAITLVDVRDPAKPTQAAYRGEVQIYPASVIKVFYLVAAHQWMEDGRMPDTPEMRRAMHDSIVYSYNESTSYLVDWLTGTTSGPELSPQALQVWHDKRNAVNRYFSLLGYTNINANKKPWGEGPYGRETQAIATFEPKRNWLTTDAAARLLMEIATGRAVTAERSQQMMALLKRDFSPAGDPPPPSPDQEDQAREFTAGGLPADAKLWAKAGYMSTQRHDAAYVELAGGAKFVLVTFTSNHAREKRIIPFVARLVAEGMAKMPA
jgi:beta-lactamase class A